MRVGLVSCVKSKLPHAAPAKDLYTSALFRGARQAVEKSCDLWFVLSAKHGLLDPQTVVKPYDETLKRQPRRYRRVWSEQILRQLRSELGDLSAATFEIHAGRDYYGYGLLQGLNDAGASVSMPTEGLGLGRRLAYYARQETRPDVVTPLPPHPPERPRPSASRGGSLRPPTGKYRPLYEHLRSLSLDRWDATFREIERILGTQLPDSARKHSAWWANERVGSHSHARAWLAAGFETQHLRLDSERVTFQRTRS